MAEFKLKADGKPKQLKLTAKSPRKEWHEQRYIFEWAKLHEGQEPRLALLSGSMNGLQVSNPAIIVRAKLCGLKPGYPDIFLPVQRFPENGLFIELKAKDYKRGKTPTKHERNQDWWAAKLRAQNYQVETCCGADAAIAVIKGYLEME